LGFSRYSRKIVKEGLICFVVLLLGDGMLSKNVVKMLNKKVIETFGKNSADTGSTSVQIALLTVRIKHLTEHMKLHKKDNHTGRGLKQHVEKRKSLIKYLKREDFKAYTNLVQSLGLRK
jgi:small subunit ribosomal protein S15